MLIALINVCGTLLGILSSVRASTIKSRIDKSEKNNIPNADGVQT